MRKLLSLYQSSVGKKVVMALSGVVLFGFVVAHMMGNLKIYQGAEKFDAYARFLREAGAPIFGPGQLLWVFRLVLLAAVAQHVSAATVLARKSLGAREQGYRRQKDLTFSYASRTMRWGGVIILAFVIYHLMHLTFGNVHPQFSHDSVYQNVVSGFRVWWVSLAYVAAMLPLGLHIYHGLWSATQTLAIRLPSVRRWRRPLAAGIAGAIALGNISIPVAVLTGWLR